MFHRRLVGPALAGIIILAVVLLPLSRVLASVSLSSFDAFPQTDRIVLRWVTASEIETLGFNLWRGTECNTEVATKLNGALIPAQGQGALGATYEFDDLDVEPDVLYEYRLEDVENGGQTNCHQEFPVQARLVESNPIASVTPVTNPGGGATSTNAPTSTTAPTGTPAPTNTPRPNSPTVTVAATAGSTGTVTIQAPPQASPTAFLNPPATQASGAPEEVVTQATETPPEEAGNGEEEVEEQEPESVDAQATTAALATAQAASEDEAGRVTEVSEATEPQTVGAARDNVPGSAQEATASDSPNEDDSSPNTLSIMLALIGGLFFTVGGIAAIWFFFINRKA